MKWCYFDKNGVETLQWWCTEIQPVELILFLKKSGDNALHDYSNDSFCLLIQWIFVMECHTNIFIRLNSKREASYFLVHNGLWTGAQGTAFLGNTTTWRLEDSPSSGLSWTPLGWCWEEQTGALTPAWQQWRRSGWGSHQPPTVGATKQSTLGPGLGHLSFDQCLSVCAFWRWLHLKLCIVPVSLELSMSETAAKDCFHN